MELKRTVTAASPTRFDLAGGTVDLWPLYLFHRDAVTVNAAVDLLARVQVDPTDRQGVRLLAPDGDREVTIQPGGGQGGPRGGDALFREVLRHFSLEHGLTIRYRFDAPKGAGLAGSSAMLTALCSALLKSAGATLPRERLLWLLRDLETRILQVPAGMQDYYPAIWGGVQALWWSAGEVRRERMNGCARALEKRILLVYTGRSRHSGSNNWAIFKKHLDGDRKVFRSVEKIVAAAHDVVHALRKGDFHAVGKAIAAEVEARRKLFPGVVSPETRALESTMKRQGAVAVKVCGAGGGGCVLVYTEPERKDRLADAVRKGGYTNLPFRISRRGLVFRMGAGDSLM